MAGTLHGPFSLLPGLGHRRARTPSKDWFLGATAAVALAAVIAIASGLRTERDGLRGIPGEQRAALFARTVDELRQFCGDGRPVALNAHCRELAAFASQFDECRDDCAALVQPHLAPRPMR